MSLDSLKASTDALFEKYGKEMTYRVTPLEGPPYDPTPGTPVDHTVHAAPPMEYAQELRDGTLVQLHDLRVSVAADSLSVEPHTGNGDEQTEFRIDGDIYQIIAVHAIYYGDTVGQYDLQVRK